MKTHPVTSFHATKITFTVGPLGQRLAAGFNTKSFFKTYIITDISQAM